MAELLRRSRVGIRASSIAAFKYLKNLALKMLERHLLAASHFYSFAVIAPAMD